MSFDIDIVAQRGAFEIAASFRADPGITVLFGPSGAGKTSVLDLIAGILTPKRGRIAVDGQVLYDSSARVNLAPEKRRVGYIFQDARLFPHLSVHANLLYGYNLTPQGQRYSREGHIVDLLGIGHLLARAPASLSGGEQQRVAIGRAILASPRLLLMDEPLASLDEARKQEILPYIERLRSELKIPILYVTHLASEVDRRADVVVEIAAGRVTAQRKAKR